MSRKNTIHRCGCDDRLNLPSVTGSAYTCSDACGEAPCHYAIVNTCPIKTDSGEVLLPKCTLLKKNCITGNVWSSMWDASTQLPLVPSTECSYSICPVGSSACGCEDYGCFELSISDLRGLYDNLFYRPDPNGVTVSATSAITGTPILMQGGGCHYYATVGLPVEYDSSDNPIHYLVVLFNLYLNNDGTARFSVSAGYTDGCRITDNLLEIALDRFDCASTAINADDDDVRTFGPCVVATPTPGGITAMLTGLSGNDCRGDGTASNFGGSQLQVSFSNDDCYWTADDLLRFERVKLLHESNLATVTITSFAGEVATYTGAVTDCRDPITVELSETVEGIAALPRYLCLIPGTKEPKRVCDTAESQCNCCDNGDDLPYSIVLTGCGGEVNEFTGTIPRVTSQAGLPSGVTYPVSAPCGVFWLTLAVGEVCGDYSGTIGLLFYCDGSSYTIGAYCQLNDESFEYVDDCTVTNEECRCGEVYFEFSLPEMPCCCGGTIETTCCEELLPETLYLTLASLCPMYDGLEIAMTYSAAASAITGHPTWSGDYGFEAGVCDESPRSGNFLVECTESGWLLTGTGLAGPATNNLEAGTCAPLLVEFTDMTTLYDTTCCPNSTTTLLSATLSL